MNRRPSKIASPLALAGLLTALLAGAALPARAQNVVGLTTTNALLTFDSATPNNGSTLTTITGLQSFNERILGIDLRPTTGLLYGISTDSKVYSLTLGGAATFVSALSSPLASSVIGFDFNPVADLSGAASLRIVSSTGQNYAYNVGTGATIVATPVQTGFAAVAYANNDTDPATGTALYYIDTASDTLRFAPGAFNNPAIAPVGPLGLDATGVSGFDIFGSSTAFAAMTDADTGKSGLYSIDLMSGAATFVGAFGIGGDTAIAPPLLGLTVAAVTPVPEPETYALMLGGLALLGGVARRRRQRMLPV